jgi:exonuclease SbcC
LTDQLGLLAEEQKLNREDVIRLELHRKTEPYADVIRRHEAARQALAGKSEVHKTAKQNLEGVAEDLGKRIADFNKALADVAKSKQDSVKESEVARIDAEAQLVKLKKWLSDHEQDASLASKVGPLASAIKDRDSTSDALGDVWSDWIERADEIDANAAKALPESPAEMPEVEFEKSLKAYCSIVEPIHVKLKQELEAMQKELLLKKEHYQKTLLLQSYEEQRGQLREGDPCALCGSTHHPYAKEAHKFTPASHLEKELKKAERAYELQKEKVNEATTALKQLVKDTDKVRKAHAECLKAESRLADQFKKAGLKAEDKADVDSLQERANTYAENEKELTKTKVEAKKHTDAGKEAEAAIATIVKRQERLANVPEGVQIGSVYKGKIDLGQAEKSYDEAIEEFRDADAEQKAAGNNLKSAEAEMAAAEALIVAANELKKARMDADEVDRIDRAKGRIERLIVAAKAKLETAESTRDALIKEGVPQGDKAANIQQDYEEIFAKNNELTTFIADRRSELRNDDQCIKDRERLLKEIGDEGRVVETWRLLRELVGSADGSKFRKFAQSITLELLIRHANRHMLKLSDRYKILREPLVIDSKGQKAEDELGLIVEDYDQANARRPMASLSGGESFLASLALALGLSDLAGRTVRIETLFIDEGFGTLDPDTLDVALTALEGLREGNKSVGIISHVEALKERITTQIVVTKVSSGHSTLSVIS